MFQYANHSVFALVLSTHAFGQNIYTFWTNERTHTTKSAELKASESIPLTEGKTMTWKVTPFDGKTETGKGAPLFITDPYSKKMIPANQTIPYGETVESLSFINSESTLYYEVRYKGQSQYLPGYYLKAL